MSPYKNRIPVVYRGKPLMPMTWKRAKKYCKLGFGRIRSIKDRLIYLQLLKEPSGFNLQSIVLGIDPGSMFDGFTVLSNREHLLNIELIHNLEIIKRMEKRKGYRRKRRSRLWSRRCRMDNRTSTRLEPTYISKVNFRIETIKTIIKLFPISLIGIEDVSYNHYKKSDGRFFSQVEVGKNYLYRFIKSIGIQLYLIKGYETKHSRIRFCNGNDPKKNNKADKSFFAHCIDSLVIANIKLDFENFKFNTNFKVLLIKKISLVRRELHRDRNRRGEKKRFFRYKKHGEIKFFEKKSRIIKIRVNSKNTKTFHGPWEYRYVPSIDCYKRKKVNYGGTIVIGGPRWKEEDIGKPKKLVIGNYVEYKNRNIELI